MGKIRIINLQRSVFEDNDLDADRLRDSLKKRKVFYVNVMSSPGAGKTTTLIALINRLKQDFSVGVMEADIDSDVDAVKVAEFTGCKSVQLHTGGMCHIDAEMSRQGLKEMGDLDIVFLENVGNLVCPAEFDAGAAMNVVISSVPEGDDKPLKYPLIFEKSELVILNKIDAMPYFDFDRNEFEKGVRERNKTSTIIEISAKTGENIDKLTKYFKDKIIEWRGYYA